MSTGWRVFLSLLLVWVAIVAGLVSFGFFLTSVEDRSPRLFWISTGSFVVAAAAVGWLVALWVRS